MTRVEVLPVGAKSVVGARSTMEDAYAVLPDGIRTRGTSVTSQSSLYSISGSSDSRPSSDDVFSYFAVFDGHGGNEAAQHCAARLHLNLQDSLATASSRGSVEEPCNPLGSATSLILEDRPVSSISLQCSCGSAPGTRCSSCRVTKSICSALKQAFQKTDSELNGTEVGEVVGSTAVVALVGSSHIYVAHCGDSRAVICRNGLAHALTADHKPNRKDECERVEAAGGKVLHKGGSHRVMGLLAMSRAIGDHFLRPFIVADPEVSCHPRQLDDEVLLIATDGLWDVFSNQDAMALAIRCINRARNRGASMRAACRIAASVLTKAALERGSRDNITVVLVDLRAGQSKPGEKAGSRLRSGSSTPLAPSIAALEMRRSRSQDCSMLLSTGSGLEMPIRRASSNNSFAHGRSAFELAQRRCQQQLPQLEQPPEVAASEADEKLPAFDPAISLPPVMAPLTPLEVRLGKLRTSAGGADHQKQQREQQQQEEEQEQPQPQQQLAPAGLQLPPRALSNRSLAALAMSSSASEAAPQESLPYMPSGNPFGCWASPVMFTQQTAPVPALQKHGSGGCGVEGFGQAGLLTNPSAPVLCDQVSG